MAHGPEKKREARRLYVIERRSLPTISKAIGVKPSTLSQWKRKAKAAGDDWQAAREAHLVAGQGLESIMAATAERFVQLATQLMNQIERAIDASPDGEIANPGELVQMMTALSDAMTKMVASAGKLAPKVSELGVAQDVVRRLDEGAASGRAGRDRQGAGALYRRRLQVRGRDLHRSRLLRTCADER